MTDGSAVDKPSSVGITTNTMPVQPFIDLKLAFADALWEWARVETQVFAIYIATIGGGLSFDFEQPRAAFFAINSFEMRLVMTHALMKGRWSRQPEFKEWTILYDRCKGAARERNRIAHRAGDIWWPEKPHQKPIVVLSEPSWHSKRPKTWGEAKSTGVDGDMLKTYFLEWHTLNHDLMEFAVRLSQPKLPPPFGARD